jgi:hypothetical protein
MMAKSLILAGAPSQIRTGGLRIRSPALYPLSYGRIYCMLFIVSLHDSVKVIAQVRPALGLRSSFRP